MQWNKNIDKFAFLGPYGRFFTQKKHILADIYLVRYDQTRYRKLENWPVISVQNVSDKDNAEFI